MFDKTKDSLIYKYDNEVVNIEAWGKNGLRIRVTKNPEFTKHDWALLQKEEITPTINIDYKDYSASKVLGLDGVKDESCASISNGKITAVISATGSISFLNSDGKLLLKERWGRKVDEPSLSLERSGREFKSISGSNFKLSARFEPTDGEKLYGMGQYQMKYLDLKGCTLELAHRNSQASVPFVVSSEGYGFLWNNPAIGRCTFGKNETEWVAESTKQLDYWICAGDTPAEILDTYTSAVGKAPMMPDYAMGFWQCKLRYRSQEELLNVARKHKELGLPLDVIVADFFHWTQQGEWKFDPKYWPDVAGMCEELESMGIKLMVSIWPTVDHRSENFDEMMAKGLLVRTERGVRITMQMFGQQVFMDPTNPDTREFLWGKAKQNYWDNGVNIFWLDEAEPEYSVYDYDNYRYYLGSNEEVGNIYPVAYAKTFYDGMKAEGMENPLNLLRCAWAGSQKYGALVWSGDIDSTWDAFQRQVRAGLSMGMAGIAWWTADIGGFHGGNIETPEFKELLVRWFQYGCFNAVFRLHGFRSPIDWPEDSDLLGGTGTFGTGAANEVWSFGDEVYEILKKYLFVRERIKPYVVEIMEEAHETGAPAMRTLFFEFPNDENAWNIEDQYMFGQDLLVAPILNPQTFEREVYLPAGATWKNVWTGAEYEGGQYIKVEAPIDQIPLFTKNGRELNILEK
ncbi:MAG: glycoside hydrolase family 31 protein [Clostridiaceae bacterium]|nr:glycoside hydrolase family 31 protein [Clostridiaceae bacterium]